MTFADVLRWLETAPPGTSVPASALLEMLRDAVPATDEPAAKLAKEEDRWLTAEEVATQLRCSRRYVYAHVDDFSFAKRLPTGAIRFSERGLRRWMERTNLANTR